MEIMCYAFALDTCMETMCYMYCAMLGYVYPGLYVLARIYLLYVCFELQGCFNKQTKKTIVSFAECNTRQKETRGTIW